MKYVILFVLVGFAAGLTAEKEAQLAGFKALLQDSGDILATCNIVLFKEKVNYTAAEDNCKSFNIGGGSGVQDGVLATVNDDEKNEDLKALLLQAYPENNGTWAENSWVWAGLKKIVNTEGQGKKKFIPSEWQWSDGTMATADEKKYWRKKQPDQAVEDGLYQNQMRISRDGEWDDTFVNKIHPYACDYQGKYIFSTQLKTWEAAAEMCANASLVLAMVRNEAEVTEFRNAAVSFLGPAEGKVFDPNNWLWLGGTNLGAYTETNDWQWMDGSPVEAGFADMPWFRKNPDFASKKIKIDGKKTKVVQDRLSLSKDEDVGFDDSFYYIERPFACQCPDT